MITSTDPAPFNDTTTTNYNLPSRTTTVSVPAAGGNPNTTALTTADLLGRKVAEHLGNFPDATYTYDPVGNLLTSTDPAGVTTTYQYNPFSQVTKTTRATGDNTYPASSAVNVDTLYNYDAAGRLSSTVDPRAQNAMDANHTWTYVYDGDGRLISSTLPAPLSTTTSIVYDDAGERLKITDGAGHARFWTYDVRGRATKFTDGDGNQTTYTYDDDNRPYLTTLPASMDLTQNFTYDNLGRLIRRYGVKPSTSATVDDEQFGYDPNNNMTSASNTNATVNLVYDEANRLHQVLSGSTLVTQYNYDHTQLTSMSDPAGTTKYGYRATTDGLLASVTDPFSGVATTYGYDPYGRQNTRSDPDGLTTTRTWDKAGRLDTQTTMKGTTQVALFNLDYDPASNVTKKHQEVSGYASSDTGDWLYGFDNANRIASGQAPGAASATTYAYDGAGNRKSITPAGLSTITTTFDGAGYPVSATDGSTYTPDALGRIIKTVKGTTTTTFTYDTWSRLTKWTKGTTVDTYAFDALDRTAQRTSGSVVTNASYVGTTEEPAALTTGSTTTAFAYTPGGPLAQQQGSTLRYFLTDFHQDVVALVDPATGGTVGTTSFGPWGQKRATTGEQSALGFQSDVTDADSGLVDMTTRDYDPTTGRFITQDSLFGDPTSPTSLNQWVYAQDGPVTYTDPTGMIIEGGSGCYNSDCNKYDSGRVGHGGVGVSTTLSSYWCSYCSSTGGWVPSYMTPAPPKPAVHAPVHTAPRLNSSAQASAWRADQLGAQQWFYTWVKASLGVQFFHGGIGPVGLGVSEGDEALFTKSYGEFISEESAAAETEGVALNSAGQAYPEVLNPGTGEPIPYPGEGLSKVPVGERVPWGAQERGEFIKEWYDRGFSAPDGGWSDYDIHHIVPREYGGTNDFENLVPVERGVHQSEFNAWWRGY